MTLCCLYEYSGVPCTLLYRHCALVGAGADAGIAIQYMYITRATQWVCTAVRTVFGLCASYGTGTCIRYHGTGIMILCGVCALCARKGRRKQAVSTRCERDSGRKEA